MKRLPFGWTHAPKLAQLLSTQMIAAFIQNANVHAFIYIDDILILSEDRETLKTTTSRILAKLDAIGIKAAKEKCITKPTRTVTFLAHELHNTTARCLVPIPKIPRSGSCNLLRRILGIMEYIYPQARFYTLAVQSYLAACSNAYATRDYPTPVTDALRSAARICARGASKHPQPLAKEAAAGPPQRTLFADASAKHGRAGVITTDQNGHILHSQSIELPPFIPRNAKGQQAAELYALIYAIKRATRYTQICSPLVVSDSMTALASVARCKAFLRGVGRARLMQWATRTLREIACRHETVHLGYIDTSANPADEPSRRRKPQRQKVSDAQSKVRAWLANRPITC